MNDIEKNDKLKREEIRKQGQKDAYYGKEHFNISTVGHIDHGKTTLSAAISKVAYEISSDKFNKVKSYEEIDNAKEEKARGITINASHIEYITSTRHYSHVDCPGHSDYIKNMIIGVSSIDGAIIVVAATEGPMPQTDEHMAILKNLNVKNIVVFYNKMDMVESEDFTELFETIIKPDMEERLSNLGYTDVKHVEGSALLALKGDESKYGVPAIKQLLSILDGMSIPNRKEDGDFYMQVHQALEIQGRGRTLTGIPTRGSVSVNDQLELVTPTHRVSVRVSEIQTHHKALQIARAGDDVSILLKDAPGGDADLKAIFSDKKSSGKTKTFVLSKTNTAFRYKEFLGMIHMHEKERSALVKALQSSSCPQIFIGSLVVTVSLIGIYNINQLDELEKYGLDLLSSKSNENANKPESLPMITHGEQAIMHFSFNIPDKTSKNMPPRQQVIEQDLKLLLMEGKRGIGAGFILRVIGEPS